ncbi:histidinol phosphate phosphatase domain-containing protein [Methanobrevibacter curvatus]|uniref:DNA polymerase/3'-5' exonuclease PolX n=1 Tax=Methanobrevibacter curvatus TaxID=49547 RepID=A0A166CIN4_9EURY|nr:histidinol phosphate phosphatase domain-containing protein [Methanobrevibacter curvatus]KZX14549.1 DNA polymerase/3'-5' exonuclease PolX [Methanobrevibacter curvatus]
MNKRIDLHTHSIFSDGELLPSELARRADILGHSAIAITDHVDDSNLDIIEKIANAIDEINEYWDIKFINGVEITHVPIETIDRIAKKAKDLGAEIVVVHGETLAEPVVEGTNLEAVKSEYVDILAHPGLITNEELAIAVENDVYIEISGRKGHSLSNGYVASLGREFNAKFLINSDGHAPGDLMNFNKAELVGLGAGLSEKEVKKALVKNPNDILKKIKK